MLTSQIDQLVNFIAAGHATVAERLRGLEREAEAQRVEVTALEKEATAVIELPAPDDLFELVFDLEKRLLADPPTGLAAAKSCVSSSATGASRSCRDRTASMSPERDTSAGSTYATGAPG